MNSEITEQWRRVAAALRRERHQPTRSWATYRDTPQNADVMKRELLDDV